MIRPWQFAVSGLAGTIAGIPVVILARPPAWLGAALGIAFVTAGVIVGTRIFARRN